MINHKIDKLTAQIAKSKQTEMQVAANSRSSLNATKKVLSASTKVNLETINRVADYLGFDVEIRYIPRRRIMIPPPETNGASE